MCARYMVGILWLNSFITHWAWGLRSIIEATHEAEAGGSWSCEAQSSHAGGTMISSCKMKIPRLKYAVPICMVSHTSRDGIIIIIVTYLALGWNLESHACWTVALPQNYSSRLLEPGFSIRLQTPALCINPLFCSVPCTYYPQTNVDYLLVTEKCGLNWL